MRLLMMRYFNWSPQTFDAVYNPGNCDFWVLVKDEARRAYRLEPADCSPPCMPWATRQVRVVRPAGAGFEAQDYTLVDYLALPQPRTSHLEAALESLIPGHGHHLNPSRLASPSLAAPSLPPRPLSPPRLSPPLQAPATSPSTSCFGRRSAASTTSGCRTSTSSTATASTCGTSTTGFHVLRSPLVGCQLSHFDELMLMNWPKSASSLLEISLTLVSRYALTAL